MKYFIIIISFVIHVNLIGQITGSNNLLIKYKVSNNQSLGATDTLFVYIFMSDSNVFLTYNKTSDTMVTVINDSTVFKNDIDSLMYVLFFVAKNLDYITQKYEPYYICSKRKIKKNKCIKNYGIKELILNNMVFFTLSVENNIIHHISCGANSNKHNIPFLNIHMISYTSI